MKTFKELLTQERLRELMHYDPETGVFTNLVKRGPRALVGGIAGHTKTNGYVEIMISCHYFKASRLAWFYMTGQWPENEIDHINHDRSDNRWVNLRDVTHQENLSNRKWRPSVQKVV